jgi:DnaJ-domain-containing protein 1
MSTETHNSQHNSQHWGPIYVYAIVPSEAGHEGVIDGVDAVPDRLAMIGEGPYAAVVGNDRGRDLQHRDRIELGRWLVAHQRVIEHIMRTAPVLPVKFGTQAPDETVVRKALRRGARLFEAAFAELHGSVQMEILVTWDLDAVFADIAGEEPVARLNEQLSARASEVEASKREFLGKLVKESLERRRISLSAHLLDALRAVATDIIVSPSTNDRVVSQLSLLLKADALSEIDHCLEALDAEYGGRLRFRCIGPMPPASFATVEIEFLETDEIERASRVLKVGPTPKLNDVRAAYCRLAKRVHPDMAASGGEETQDMAALTQAYKLLERYRRASEAVDGSGGASLEATDDSACAVVVSIRRNETTSGTPVVGAEA